MLRFEQILKLQGFDIGPAMKFLDSSLAARSGDFTGWQEDRKREIVEFHLKHNSFYRQKAGVDRMGQWNELPILKKGDYQADITRLLSNGFNEKNTYIANTSGSSGHPFYFAKDKFCHALAWSIYKDRYSQYGLTLNSLQARFYGIPLERVAYYKEKLKDKVMSRVRFPVFDLSEPTLEKFLGRFKKKRFEYIYGYTSAMVMFARFLLSRGIVLKNECSSLKVAIVTSEVCTEQDRSVLQEAFGIGIVNEYGASELGIMAFEYPDGQMKCTDELIFFENHVKEDGSEVLLCTSLFNKAFPMIRYEIGDRVELQTTEGGRTNIGSINGRVNDVIKLPGGKTAAGLTFYYISRSVLESSGCLKEFIIRQTKLDTFEFDIVSDRVLNEEEEQNIREKVALYIDKGLEIRFNYMDHIKRPANGKIKHFYSEL